MVYRSREIELFPGDMLVGTSVVMQVNAMLYIGYGVPGYQLRFDFIDLNEARSGTVDELCGSLCLGLYPTRPAWAKALPKFLLYSPRLQHLHFVSELYVSRYVFDGCLQVLKAR